MLADILHIFGDIGLVIGNIREAADYTAEWSETLDFSPLLESIEHLTKALIPFADFVSFIFH
ncbi:MAG: hypothetical protein NC314_04575 [Roseburia sp.]|nr:hypothetical protein [Roseburia sp.]MCM1242095.1 hypothetical protein [Roseburia sp.]